MDSATVVWGLIGCGDVAETKSGPAFQKCENSHLLAVMRRNDQKAKDFAVRHKVAMWYNNAKLLLENKKINAIYIATPPSKHLSYALQVLESGKDVYIEKPMVLNLEEALTLKLALEKSNNKLVVAHYRRNLPLYLKVKSILESGVLGNVKYVDLKYLKTHNTNTENYWRLDSKISGGGHFHDLAPHQLDLMYYFFGEHEKVYGFSLNQEAKYSLPDVVNGIINFKNGIQFRGIWSFDVPLYMEEDKCTVYGKQGYLSFSFYGNELEVTINNKTTQYNFENPENIQQPFIQETINYFLGKRNNPCSIDEGIVITKIIDKMTNKK
jgi:predicted dehydrogenase